jgi:pimeloyl-ACP methyl ester carboxylesterase
MDAKMRFQRLSQQGLGLMLIIFFLFGCSTQPKISASEVPGATETLTSPTAQAPVASTVTATALATLPGKFEVNGRFLYIKCLGSGSPTIVLEPGEGGTHSDMKELQERLAKLTTTCTYDRSHTGGLRTAQDVVDDLYALLAAADVPGPVVLVGSSAGGMFVQLYACKYADQVVGVVAMNPVPPAHPWLDEVSQISTQQEYAEEEAYYRGKNGESFDYLSSSDQLLTAGKPPDVPFEMLLSTNVQCEGDEGCLKSYSTYEQILQDVTSTWPRGKFSQVAAGHEIYVSNMDAVVIVVEHILTAQ